MKAVRPAKQWWILMPVFLLLILAIHFDWPEKLGAWHAEHFGPPPVPVKFSVRDGLIGKVAVFQNEYGKTLSVLVTFKNQTFNETKQYALVLSPGETKEIGWLEGWRPVPGETITLSSDGWTTRMIEYSE